MAGIFLSYRRGPGASEAAGRLHDRLASRFGDGNVFMDVDTVRPGTDFVDAIGRAIASSNAVLAIIDPNWATGDSDRNRIADPDDYVRLEIATALEQGASVIPVLVLGARMPTRNELPSDLEPLARRQAVVLSHERFTTDVIPLERELSDLLATPKPKGAAPVAAAPPPSQNSRRRGRGVLWVVLVVLLAGAAAIAIVVWPKPEPPGVGGLVIIHAEIMPNEAGEPQLVVVVRNEGDGPGNGTVHCQIEHEGGGSPVDFAFDDVAPGEEGPEATPVPAGSRIIECHLQ